ncbi:hypothetical protein GCM10017774_38390 [Lentzea cavernae]|uniref:Uncharacterized protein n=1 Tax=Lentzea cavernae TaxID=2020703 RepID=A0ABQ3MPM5_9PSEU|nr:hypothetical protein GCM10017774_38390 [Lentzea cavernae]
MRMQLSCTWSRRTKTMQRQNVRLDSSRLGSAERAENYVHAYSWRTPAETVPSEYREAFDPGQAQGVAVGLARVLLSQDRKLVA